MCVRAQGKCVAADSGTQASTLTCHTITSTCRSRKTRTPKVRNFLSDNRILRFATRLNSYRLVCGHMYRLNNRFEPGAVIIIGRPPDAMRRRRYRLFDRVRPMRTKAISVSSSFQILFGTVQHSAFSFSLSLSLSLSFAFCLFLCSVSLSVSLSCSFFHCIPWLLDILT